MEDDIEATDFVEEVEGIVQCYGCKFWGKMLGYLNPADPKYISFVCPECNKLERVVNPE